MSEAMRFGTMEDPAPEEAPSEAAETTAEPEAVQVDPSQENAEIPAPPLDLNEELWEGGPTYGDIEAWKQQYKDVYVTSVTPDTHYVWRTLTRFEYRRLVKNIEQQMSTGQVSQAEANMNNEESIAEMCILFPKVTRQDLAGEMAGLASIISQEVMETSAFVALEIRQL